MINAQSHDLQLQLELDKMAAEKRGLSDEVVALTHSLDEHRAQSAKREAEWVESKEVVRGGPGGSGGGSCRDNFQLFRRS